MTLASLRAHTYNVREEFTETRSGIFIFDGRATNYHEWEFRTLARYHGTKEEDKATLGGKVLEGLKGDAYLVVQDMGITELSKPGAVPVLVDLMKKMVFPHLRDEAKELYREGQRKDGSLARAAGESMP